MRVQRQLALDDERRNEDDLGTAVGGEPAGEIERGMLRTGSRASSERFETVSMPV